MILRRYTPYHWQSSANYISDTTSSTSTVPPSTSISSHLWPKALEITQESLTKYKLPSLERGILQPQSATEDNRALVAELETARREIRGRQWGSLWE